MGHKSEPPDKNLPLHPQRPLFILELHTHAGSSRDTHRHLHSPMHTLSTLHRHTGACQASTQRTHMLSLILTWPVSWLPPGAERKGKDRAVRGGFLGGEGFECQDPPWAGSHRGKTAQSFTVQGEEGNSRAGLGVSNQGPPGLGSDIAGTPTL